MPWAIAKRLRIIALKKLGRGSITLASIFDNETDPVNMREF